MSVNSTSEHGADIAALLEKFGRDTLELGRAEFASAKREVVEDVRSVGTAAALLCVALMAFQAALTTLGVLLLLMLHASAASFGVVGALVVFALILALVARNSLKRNPVRSIDRVKTDGAEIIEAIK